MAVQFAAVVSILGGLGKHLLEIPLIHRGVENWLDSNIPTIWDKILWHGLIENVAGIVSPTEREAEVVATAGAVQDAYDEVKVLEKREGSPMTPAGIKQVVVARGLPWIEEPTGEA